MDLIFTTQPSVGHLNPLIPIAHELARRGNRITFAVSPRFVGLVESMGLDAQGFGVGWLGHEYARLAKELGMSALEESWSQSTGEPLPRLVRESVLAIQQARAAEL